MEEVMKDVDKLKCQMESQKSLVERVQKKKSPLDINMVLAMYEENLEVLEDMKKKVNFLESSHRSCGSNLHFYGSTFRPQFNSTPIMSSIATTSNNESSDSTVIVMNPDGSFDFPDASSNHNNIYDYTDASAILDSDTQFEQHQTFEEEELMHAGLPQTTEVSNNSSNNKEDDDDDDSLLELEDDNDIDDMEGAVVIKTSDLLKEAINATSTSSVVGKSYIMTINMDKGEERRLKSKKKRQHYTRGDYHVSVPDLVELDENDAHHQRVVKLGSRLIASCVVYDGRSHIMLNCACGSTSKNQCVVGSRCACFGPKLATVLSKLASSTMVGEISNAIVYVDIGFDRTKAKAVGRHGLKVLIPERFVGIKVCLGPLPPAWMKFAQKFKVICLAFLERAETFKAVQMVISIQMKVRKAKALAASPSKRDEILNRVTTFGPEGNQNTRIVLKGRMSGTGRKVPTKKDEIDWSKVTLQTIKRPFGKGKNTSRVKDQDGKVTCTKCKKKYAPANISGHERACNGVPSNHTTRVKDKNGKVICTNCKKPYSSANIKRHEMSCQGVVVAESSSSSSSSGSESDGSSNSEPHLKKTRPNADS